MNRSTITQQNRCQRGFTLLEVLIALVVLSIGLLSLAGLQATGLRNNHSAYLRSQATLLAYDAIDRIRANRSAAASYVIGLGAIPTSASTQAYTDLLEWTNAVGARLPSGQGSISLAGNVVTVLVQWDNSHGAQPPVPFTVTTRL